MRTANLIADFIGDLGYAGRSLRKNPEFATLTILVMALGIGANTAVFSVVNAVLLKQLPYPGADRIVTVATWDAARRAVNPLVAIANYRDWRDQASLFDAMASYRAGETPVTPGNTAEYARAATVDLQFFSVFGVDAAIGRTFVPEEMAPRSTVALLSHAYWQSRFGGDPAILQRTIFCTFDVQAGMTIVGVVGDTRQRNPGAEPMPDCIMPYSQHGYNGRTLNMLVRTAGDPTAFVATLRRIAVDVSPEVPVAFTTLDATVAKTVEDPRFRAMLVGVFAALAVGLAMAGVYGVMAYGVQQRSREIGVRIALGASSGSVLRLMLEQGALLAGIGLLIGLAGAAAATRVLKTILFEVQPIDAQVYFAVAMLLGLVTLAAAYVPARRAAGMDPTEILRLD